MIAQYCNQNPDMHITLITDTINNLYDMLDNYEIDLGHRRRNTNRAFPLFPDAGYRLSGVCYVHPASFGKTCMVTLSELKQERMILRLPTSDTRMLFESTLKSIGDSIDNFNITLEVDNIATIKDLVRKGLGVSILPQSACAREQKKGKMAVLLLKI